MGKIRYALAATGLSALLALTACGQGDNAGSNGGNGSDKGPIVIGAITSLSGQYSVLGGFTKNTLDLYVDQVNAAGGIDGRKVKVEYADDQTNPTQAAIALRKMIAKKPVAIVGPILSSSCLAIADKVDQAKIPMVTTCATDSQADPVRPYVFMATLPTPGMTQQVGNYLNSVGKKKVAILYDQGDFGASGLKAFKAQGDLDIVAEAGYQLSSTTFVPQLSTLTRSNADAIIVWGAGPPLVTIAKEYAQLGSKVPMVFSGAAATPLFLKPAGSAANGMIMASSLANLVDQVPSSNTSKAKVAALAAAYQARYSEPMSQFTADTCGAWEVITSAIAKVGTDPQKVRDAIEANPAVGCHGTYHYSPTDHRGLQASDVWIAVDHDGALTATDFSVNATK
jgi:branched-chain amino acid transport system substrate-binding protein